MGSVGEALSESYIEMFRVRKEVLKFISGLWFDSLTAELQGTVDVD